MAFLIHFRVEPQPFLWPSLSRGDSTTQTAQLNGSLHLNDVKPQLTQRHWVSQCWIKTPCEVERSVNVEVPVLFYIQTPLSNLNNCSEVTSV